MRNTLHSEAKDEGRNSVVALVLCCFFRECLAHRAKAQKTSAPEGQTHYAKLDGARIHYQSYGKGSEALVFIHGWTCNLDYWRDQVPDFAKRNRVIAIDLPGHGQSDKPQVAYSMDLFARAVDAVMRDANGEACGVGGP